MLINSFSLCKDRKKLLCTYREPPIFASSKEINRFIACLNFLEISFYKRCFNKTKTGSYSPIKIIEDYESKCIN